MSIQDLVSDYENRLSSAHSSPAQVFRNVPLVGLSVAFGGPPQATSFVLVQRGRNDPALLTDTPVAPGQVRFLSDRPDGESPDLIWSHYKYVGGDERARGEYFLYQVRGSVYHLRHADLFDEYRSMWLPAGQQRVRMAQSAQNLSDDAISFAPHEGPEGDVQQDLNETVPPAADQDLDVPSLDAPPPFPTPSLI